ncbi:hypothetical protein GCM10009801_30160 [Streptomyces albiaxialis]|uniref:TPM domain-containing protein n=1 Tax=Streptomyces albiaxialis TaxID=329523 RepID=A0ABN2VWL2_9ACTN
MSTEPRAALGALRTALVAVLSATLLCLLPAGTAHAEPAPGQRIADALRRSPVYVDPAYERALPPARQRALVRQIEKTGIPIRVVIVPLVKGDDWNGESAKLVDVVRDRLGESRQKEAVYVTLSDTGSQGQYLDGHEFPRDKHEAMWAASTVGHIEKLREKGLDDRISRAVEIIESGDGLKQYERATADLKDSYGKDKGGDGASGDDEGTSPAFLLVLVLGPLLLLAAGLTLFLVRRRRGRSAVRTPFAAPRTVFATARRTSESDLRRRAQEEVVALGEEVGAHEQHEQGDTALLQLALDAYAAAGTVLDSARGIPDLAGVLALVHEGREALRALDEGQDASQGGSRSGSQAGSQGGGRKGKRKRGGARLPVCFFDPLHGRATGWTRWRPLGHRESLRIAACEACAGALRARRAPEALTDTHEGRTVPYFEVPPARSLWSATGYGSLGDEPLAARVARGEFTRAAAEGEE